MHKLLVVDGHSLLFRAFFAIPHLSTKEGTPTNAIYGFMRMLWNLLQQEHPDAVVVAFDAPGPTFRHAAFEAYKANRESAPDEFRVQVPLVQQLLDHLGIARLEVPGFEADDIIGTLAKKAEAEEWKTLIVTGDNDALQLVSDSVEVLVNRRGITDVARYTPQRVRERMGVLPQQVPDVKALQGDTSDNIPGVPGVGAKTAASLIQEFENVENLLAHLDAVSKPALRAALQEHRETALRNRQLVTIARDVDITDDWKQWRWEPPDSKRLREIFEPLEFHTLLREWLKETMPHQGITTAVAKGRKVESREDLQQLSSQLHATTRCAVWWEYDSRPPYEGNVRGVAFAWGEGDTAYVPLHHLPDDAAGTSDENLFSNGQGNFCPSLESLWEMLADTPATLVTHDAKRAMVASARSGVQPSAFFRGRTLPFSFDLLIGAYLMNPSQQDHPVEDIYREYKHTSFPEYEPVEVGACHKARAMLETFSAMQERLRSLEMMRLYEEVEHPLIAVLAAMEQHGMLLDTQHLREVAMRLTRDIATLESAIFELAGESFSIGSPKQLQRILFEKLKLPHGRKTKTGYSTDASVLEKLAQEHDIVRKILDYRELTKLKSTYVDGLLSLVDPKTRRVHTRLKQTGSATGRLSSAEPNLQNIPVRTETGREIRRAFICPAGTHVLMAADYSQIELRVLAHIAEDARLVEAFRRDEDIHTRTAADLYQVLPANVTPEMRRMAKVINFGIAYGMSCYGLAANLGIPPEEAQAIIDSYYAMFPGVRNYMLSIVEQARRDGYVTTLLNRCRYLPDINSPNRQAREFAERTAINSPIQGTAADIIKCAMVAIHERLSEERLGASMTLQVHDELVFEVPQEELDEVAPMVRQAMESAVELRVPLKVDIEVGQNWRDTEKWLPTP